MPTGRFRNTAAAQFAGRVFLGSKVDTSGGRLSVAATGESAEERVSSMGVRSGTCDPRGDTLSLNRRKLEASLYGCKRLAL